MAIINLIATRAIKGGELLLASPGARTVRPCTAGMTGADERLVGVAARDCPAGMTLRFDPHGATDDVVCSSARFEVQERGL